MVYICNELVIGERIMEILSKSDCNRRKQYSRNQFIGMRLFISRAHIPVGLGYTPSCSGSVSFQLPGYSGQWQYRQSTSLMLMKVSFWEQNLLGIDSNCTHSLCSYILNLKFIVESTYGRGNVLYYLDVCEQNK